MTATLLLNASYEPLTVLSPQRAIRLMLKDKVDAATDTVITLHSPSTTFDIPTVLRLRRYINVPRRGARWSRRAVLQRDGYRCIYCGVEAGQRQYGNLITKAEFTVDHVVPRSKGGGNTWGNTACACQDCNNRKGGRTPHEAGMALLWEPKTPRVNYLVASGNLPAEWKIYLRITEWTTQNHS